MDERIISYMGMDNLKKVKSKCVLIVGIGGVGGYALESLIRSGIENIIIIDHDIISESNLNRQIITSSSNIGKYKVDVAKERVLSINKNVKVESINTFLNEDNINILNNYKIDYIVDACDTLKTKELLIDYSIKKNIKLISSMGTANKIDPTKLEILDIRKTSYDPLAKKIRKYVNDLKTNKKIMVVSSKEIPIRKDTLSSLIFVPATAGILCGKYIINDIIRSEE